MKKNCSEEVNKIRLNWCVSSQWSSQYCPMRKSDEITIRKTKPILLIAL